MSIAEQLSWDLKQALKSGDKDRLSVIRLIKSAVRNREIEAGKTLDDEEIQGVIQSVVRQCTESLEQYEKAGRGDLADKEKAYISAAQSYLPRQLSGVELDHIIHNTITEVNARGPSDMGTVMKAVIPQIKGRADNRAVSERVRRLLADEKTGV